MEVPAGVETEMFLKRSLEKVMSSAMDGKEAWKTFPALML